MHPIAGQRTFLSWQRTSLSCILFGLVLTRGFGATIAVGVVFWILGVLITILVVLYDGVQRKMYSRANSIITKNRLITTVSLVTLLAHAALLSTLWLT